MKDTNIVKAFSGIAEFYDEYMTGTKHVQAQRSLMEKLLGHIEGKVLDIGMGTGNMSLDLKGVEAIGLDASIQMVKQAKLKLGDFESLVADAYKLPFRDKSFDYSLSCLLLPWLDSRQGLCEEIKRVTRSAYIMVEEEGMPARLRITIPEHLQNFFSTIEKLEKPFNLKEIENTLNTEGVRIAESDIDGSHKFVAWMFKLSRAEPKEGIG